MASLIHTATVFLQLHIFFPPRELLPSIFIFHPAGISVFTICSLAKKYTYEAI